MTSLAIIQLQNCIADITEWMSNNTLKINEDKTEFIIFNTKGNSRNKITIEIGNTVIHMSEHVKILGVYLLGHLKSRSRPLAEQHIMQMRRINSICQYLTESAVKTIIQMMVVSRLDYCNSLFNGLPMKSIKKQQLAQNSAARIIDRTPRRAHMIPILRDLHWLPIVKSCQYTILVFTYNVLHQNAPHYVRWSAGIILIGNFDLQTQHHWTLIGTKLFYITWTAPYGYRSCSTIE